MNSYTVKQRVRMNINLNKIYTGNALDILKTLPDECIDMCMTSPPYYNLRNYFMDDQLGLENTFFEYIDKLCAIFDEVKRVLKKEGNCFVNIADTYDGNKKGNTNNKVSFYLKENSSGINKKTIISEKCLCQIPSRFAIEMTNRGWILRNRLIWHKLNAMPSSVSDRFTVDYEDVLFFVKNKKYYFEQQYEPYAESSDVRYRQALRANKSYVVKEPYKNNTPYCGKFSNLNNEELEKFSSPRARYKRGQGSVVSRGNDSDGLVVGGKNSNGRNMRSVWAIPTKPCAESHFATYPEKLCITPILAGCPVGGIILDPFFGTGTTGLVANKLDRHFIGIELNPRYVKIAQERINAYNKQLKLF